MTEVGTPIWSTWWLEGTKNVVVERVCHSGDMHTPLGILLLICSIRLVCQLTQWFFGQGVCGQHPLLCTTFNHPIGI